MSFSPESTSSLKETSSHSETNALIRYGSEATIACVRQLPTALKRGEEVVVRTKRGVELAEVLSFVSPQQIAEIPEAKWLRRARAEDIFLRRQLLKLSHSARASCQQLLDQAGMDDLLLEVEPMLDGRTLFFHFLGEPSKQTEEMMAQLSAVYEEQVRSSKFATLVEKGCGPGCGTESKSSCGTSGGCAACAASGRCGN